MKTIAIYGAGGLGREVLALIQSFQDWSVSGFFDDYIPKGSIVDGIEVKGGCEELLKLKTNVVVALGDPRAKKDLLNKLQNIEGLEFPSLIHPSAILLNKATIQVGKGTIITAGCILTTSITIGNHVLLNLNCTVGHDVVIGNYASIMPGVNLAGRTTVGECVLIGSGAQVINQSKIGERAIVGSGSVVNKDVEKNSTVVGVPARKIKS